MYNRKDVKCQICSGKDYEVIRLSQTIVQRNLAMCLDSVTIKGTLCFAEWKLKIRVFAPVVHMGL